MAYRVSSGINIGINASQQRAIMAAYRVCVACSSSVISAYAAARWRGGDMAASASSIAAAALKLARKKHRQTRACINALRA